MRNATTPAPRWVSVAELAEHFGTSTKTIRRRISDGSILAHRLGSRAIRVDLNEAERSLRPIPTAGGARG